MKVFYGDMFEHCKSGDAICVTTNGVVNNLGKLIMGAGNAKQFRDIFKGIDKKLGTYVLRYGNRVFKVGKVEVNKQVVTIFSFPTKHNWKDKSHIELIEASCMQLIELVNRFSIKGDIYIPAPGCSHGGLDWETEVKPVIERFLSENKYIICFYNEKEKNNKEK